MIKYSSDQIDAITAIEDWLITPGSPAYTLTGSAGTGKSLLMSNIDFPESTIYCAMTHKAAAVLAEKLLYKEVNTLHKAFGIQPTRDNYGNEGYKVNLNKTSLYRGVTVVVDEASMLGSKLLKIVAEQIKAFNGKILFIGDPYQLPPVRDVCTIFDGSIPTSELTTVHRQIGANPLLDKAIEYREFLEGKREYPEITESILNADGHGIHVLPEDKFTEHFVEAYIDYEAGDEIEAPMCTFKNKEAIEYNDIMRKVIYFMEDTVEPFYPEEVLVSNSAVIHAKSGKAQLMNNERVYVKDFFSAIEEGISGYIVTVKRTLNLQHQPDIERVFVPKVRAQADKQLKELKKEVTTLQQELNSKKHKGIPISKRDQQNKSAMWREYYALKGSIADLRPPFAGTTHKAQGSTYDNVYINKQDIDTCKSYKQKARLLYVALTRARYSAFIKT